MPHRLSAGGSGYVVPGHMEVESVDVLGEVVVEPVGMVAQAWRDRGRVAHTCSVLTRGRTVEV